MRKIRRKHNIVERITFGLGILSLVAIIGFLILDLNENDSLPPQLQISTSYITSVTPYCYQIRVKNTSKQTAADAEITFGLYQNGVLEESATVNFNFVPAKSLKTAWVVFYTEPKPSDSLVVISSTYVKP